MIKNNKMNFVLIMLFFIITVLLSGCNKQVIDISYKFTYAYIELPNGECIKGKVETWTDYDNSDQIQLVIDGITYFTDTTRVVMTNE